ncbi:MAG: hypothetical protein ACFNKL_07285 [Treponema sp.]
MGKKNISRSCTKRKGGPLKSDVLISLLKSGKKYPELYKDFHIAYESNVAPKQWYKELGQVL